MVTTLHAKSGIENSKSGLLSGSVTGFLARISGSFGTLVSGMVLARMLSPADFGVYMLLFNVVVVASIMGTFGVGDAAVRFVGQSLGAGSTAMAIRTAKQALAIGALGMFAVVLLFPLTRDFLVRLDRNLSIGWYEGLVIVAWIFSYGVLTHIGYLLRAFGEITAGTIAESVLYRVGIVIAFGIAIAIGHRSLISVLIGSSLVAVVSTLIAFGWLARIFARVPSSAVVAGAPAVAILVRWKELLAVGLPLYGSAVLFRLMADGTIFVVDHFRGAEAVALYGAAYRLWVAFSLPQVAVNAALQPRLAMSAATMNSERMQTLMHNAGKLAFWPTAAFAIVSLLGGNLVLSILYGPHYAEGRSVLAILSVAQLLCVFIGSSEHLMAMTGRHVAVLKVSVISAASSLLLAWILTPSCGLVGAAISAGLSSVLFKLFLALMARKELGVSTFLPLKALLEMPTFAKARATTADSSMRMVAIHTSNETQDR